MAEKNHTGLEERTAKVEGILEQMDKRLDRVEVAIVDLKNEIKADMARLEAGLKAEMKKLETGLRADMDKLEVRVDKLSEELKSNFKWLVGIIVGTWATTMLSILTIIFYMIFKGI